MTLAVEALPREARGNALPRVRIILVRHGRPAIALKPRTGHHGFRRYIDDYQDAGLDPQSAPPEELLDLVKGLNSVFTSFSPRAQDSARTLLPEAELSPIRSSPRRRSPRPKSRWSR